MATKEHFSKYSRKFSFKLSWLSRTLSFVMSTPPPLLVKYAVFFQKIYRTRRLNQFFPDSPKNPSLSHYLYKVHKPCNHLNVQWTSSKLA